MTPKKCSTIHNVIFLQSDVPLAEGDEDQEDEDKYVDDMAMPGQKMDSKQRITVRNLRIREDTAKVIKTL